MCNFKYIIFAILLVSCKRDINIDINSVIKMNNQNVEIISNMESGYLSDSISTIFHYNNREIHRIIIEHNGKIDDTLHKLKIINN